MSRILVTYAHTSQFFSACLSYFLYTHSMPLFLLLFLTRNPHFSLLSHTRSTSHYSWMAVFIALFRGFLPPWVVGPCPSGWIRLNCDLNGPTVLTRNFTGLFWPNPARLKSISPRAWSAGPSPFDNTIYYRHFMLPNLRSLSRARLISKTNKAAILITDVGWRLLSVPHTLIKALT